MATGIVKWFNEQKGFGFIVGGEGDKDIFVHYSVIDGEGYKTLKDGESVEFELEVSNKGARATRVRRIMPVAS